MKRTAGTPCVAGDPICGAKTKTGAPCKGIPMANGRCRRHGGVSTGPTLKHGRYSKFLPVRLAAG